MNSNCLQLESYFDETLAPEAAALFEIHLEDCHNCKEQLSQLRELDGLIIDAWSDVHQSTSLDPTKQNVLKPAGRPRRRRRIAQTAILGFAVAIIVALFVANQPNPPHTPDSSLVQRSDQSPQVEQVAFFDAGDDGTMLSTVVSNSDFTIVHAFANSISFNTYELNIESKQ